MAKTITTILGAVLVALIVFLAAYLYIDRPGESASQQQALIHDSIADRFDGTTSGSEAQRQTTGLETLTTAGGSFPVFISRSDEVRYYSVVSGELRSKSLKDNAIATVLTTIKPNALSISWSKDGSKVVALYAKESVLYDIDKHTQKKYDSAVHNPVLSPYSDEIAYTFFDAKKGTGTISVADPLMAAFKDLMATTTADWKITWISDHTLSLISPPGSSDAHRYIDTLDTNTKWLDGVTDIFGIAETSWSPDGESLLYSYEVNNKTFLFYANRQTQATGEVQPATRASKCAWSTEARVYCAVPHNGSDEINEFNFSSLPATMTPIAIESGNPMEIVQPVLDIMDGRLIFKNAKDNNLYLFHLPLK